MNPSSTSSSKTHNSKQKCKHTSANLKTQQQRRNKLKTPQRNPLKDLNFATTNSNNSIQSSSNLSSSSSTSIEAPKGCLRFLLSHSSSSSSHCSSKTPFSSTTRPLKSLSKTPKSATIVSKCTVLDKPISQEPSRSHKFKNYNHPCLYQWQSSKKPSSKSGAKSKTSSALDSSGKPVNKLLSRCQDLEKEHGHAVKIANDRGNDDVNLTPVSKIAFGSGLDAKDDDGDNKVVVDEEKTNSGDSNTKTPPLQASLSPEIQQQQFGSSLLSTNTATITTPACYAAGHVLSGVTDKRKCRPRGLLAVGGDDHLLGNLNKADSFNVVDYNDEENGNEAVDNSISISMVPLPAEASMHWLVSPCNEEDDNRKENSENLSRRFTRLEGRATLHSPPLLSSRDGFSSDLSNTTDKKSLDTVTNRRRTRSRSTLFAPIDFPEFGKVLGCPDANTVVSSSSNASTPEGNAATLKKEREYHYDQEGDNSPFSMDSLGSGNVMRTPQSDSSLDRCVGLSKLSARSSPKTQSIWDPVDSSFQFDCLTTSSNPIDLSHFQKILDDRTSWLSNSSIENISQSQMRISWREGLVSRIVDMDEFDRCRCLSDEEEDVNDCCNEELKSNLNIGAETDQKLIKGFGSTEFADNELKVDGKGEESLPSQMACSWAESISTDGGGLIASGDSDWSLCYKNELFKV